MISETVSYIKESYERSKQLTGIVGEKDGTYEYVDFSYIIGRLANKYSLNNEKIQKLYDVIYESFEPLKEFVITGAKEFINFAKESNIPFYIWTAGSDNRFQELKAKAVSEDTPNEILVDRDKNKIGLDKIKTFLEINPDGTVYVMDDKLTSLLTLQTGIESLNIKNKITYFWVMQGRHAEKSTNDFTNGHGELDEESKYNLAMEKCRGLGFEPIKSISDIISFLQKEITSNKELKKIILSDLDDTLINTTQVLQYIFGKWEEIINNIKI